MAIKTNYYFKGIEVKDAIIKVIRIFGSSKEGWNSLVGVYTQTTEVVPTVKAVEQIVVDGEHGYVAPIEAKEAYEKVVENLIEEFNFRTDYKEDETCYKLIYNALTEKFGGIEV